jgi:hypothetical protein
LQFKFPSNLLNAGSEAEEEEEAELLDPADQVPWIHLCSYFWGCAENEI